jgi:hypothetical protein
MLEDAIIHGRGGVCLNLTQTQYERLTQVITVRKTQAT